MLKSTSNYISNRDLKTERKLEFKKIVDVRHRHDNNTPVHVMGFMYEDTNVSQS